jgi:PAS domain S-box-containing protein
MTDVAPGERRRHQVPTILLEGLFEHSLDGVMLVELDGTALRANPAACRALGRTEDEVRRVGRAGLLVADQALQAMLAARARDGVARGELTYVRADGSTFPAEVTSALIDAGQGTQAAYVIFRDLSEQRRAEAEALENAALYRSLFNLAPTGVALTDAAGRIVAFNDRAAAQLGYTREAFSRLAVSDVDADDSAEVVRERGLDIAAHGMKEFLTRHRTRGGELRDVKVRAVSLQVKGAPAWLAVWEDVTDLRRAEAEVRRRLDEAQERETWLQASQQVARLGHYMFDIARDRWTSSPVLDQIFGIELGYLRDTGGWLALVHPDDREEMAEYLRDLLASGSRFDREYQLATPPGQPARWVHGLGELTRDEAGRPLRLFGIIQDVTERREAERVGAELANQLRQAQRLESIGRLAGGVAHDFNNILVVFLTCVDALRENMFQGHPPALEDVEELDAATRRARELTSQLLTFARKQVVAPIPLDLNEVVRRTQRLLGRLLGEDVALVTTLQPGLWTVCCDPGQLEQVIMNLAVNARDAMPRGGRLTIATRNMAGPVDGSSPSLAMAPGPHVLLVVEDTGTGLSEETKARLFEPFHTTKPAGKGTGLGLATVHGIVSQAGGSIAVWSEAGLGTRFEIAFPSVDGPVLASPVEVPPEAGRGARAPTGRILLVEDDDLVRDATSRALRSAGYDVLAAANGTEALALASQATPPPVLLLTDVVMPGLNGHQVASAVRALVPEIRVLFMSGYAQDIIVHHGVVDAGVELLQKPFSTAQFLERVRAMIESAPRPIPR